MADTLKFRGASSSSIPSTTVADREIVFDTTGNRLVLGSAKDYVHTENTAYSKTQVDTLIANNPGPQGPQGPAGATGADGAAGQGVPTGGSTGQVLSKIDGTNYNTNWATPVKLDAAQTFTAPQRGSINTLLDGATITPNFGAANNFVVTLTGTGRTLANPSNCTAGQSGVIVIKQDGTGSRTITTYGGYYKFAGGTAPTLTTDANGVDVLSYFVISATEIVATLGADFS